MNYHTPVVIGSWTNDRIELLKALHFEGLSAAQIAARLGGVTRNAVLGKMHRMGMNADMHLTESERAEKYARQAKARELREARRAERKHRAKAASPEQSRRSTLYQMFVSRPINDLSERAKHIAFIDLEPHHCRFPYGLGPYTFCGHDKADGSAYCPEHHLLCCTEIKPRLPNVRTAHTSTFSVWA